MFCSFKSACKTSHRVGDDDDQYNGSHFASRAIVPVIIMAWHRTHLACGVERQSLASKISPKLLLFAA